VRETHRDRGWALLLLLFAYAVVCRDCLLSHLFVRSLVAICGLVCQIPISSTDCKYHREERFSFGCRYRLFFLCLFSMSLYFVAIS
jgi:hypothetical protein